MHRVVLANAALGWALVALTGCPTPPGGPDAGPPPDMCNSLSEALSQSECNLPLGGSVAQYVGAPADVDWFRVEMPAGMTAKDLIRIRGGYGTEVPQTPVSFTMSVVHGNADGGMSSLGRVVDRHGQAAPKLVELVFRAPQPYSNPLVVQAADENVNPALPKSEPRYEYKIFAEHLTDLDVNEPNDATPTPITLAGSSGTAQGYLSVADDVDLYSVVVPSSTSPRKILYVHVTAPLRASPVVPYRLQFTLYDPNGVPVSENITAAGAQFLAADLATARIAQGGTWLIKVQAYREQGWVGPVPGDLTYAHTVGVSILDEQDANEPNDGIAAAVARTISTVGSSTQITGRIEYAADQDWYRVNVPSNAARTVLHYKLTPNGPGGRFAPLGGDLPDRQLSVYTEVTGYPDRAAATLACQSDPAVCPPGYLDDSAFLPTVMDLCSQNDPPRCLEARRAEDSAHVDLRNFEGTIPIPANRATSFVFVFQSLKLWVDDRDYTLDVQWRADPDEAGRTFSGGIEQPITVPLAEDPNPVANGFPDPFSGATVLTGTLSHGHGMVFDPNLLLEGGVIRASWDYDAVMSDVDKWELTIPPQDPSQPLDRTWELQWEVRKAVDGTVVHDLDVEVVFCDGDQLTGGNCTPVAPTSNHGFALTYSGDNVHSWHNTSDYYQPAWSQTADGGTTKTTATAYGCFCFEPRFVKGGKFDINVLALNRQSYEPVTYTLRTAFASYPQQYQLKYDGGSKSCPPAVRRDAGVPDGGPDAGEPDAGADAGVPDAGPAWLSGCQFISSPL